MTWPVRCATERFFNVTNDEVGYGDQATVNEIMVLLECEAVRSDRHMVTFQRKLLPPSSGYF